MSQEVSVRGTGGAVFAGILLIIAGVLWMLEGLAGIVKGTSYIESANYWITTSASTWGWIHLVGGIIGLAAGFGVFSGAAWARWLGIFIAAISVFVNFAFIPLAPWWALTIIFIRPVGDPLAVRASSPARLTKGRKMRAAACRPQNRRKGPPMTEAKFDEIETRG